MNFGKKVKKTPEKGLTKNPPSYKEYKSSFIKL